MVPKVLTDEILEDSNLKMIPQGLAVQKSSESSQSAVNEFYESSGHELSDQGSASVIDTRCSFQNTNAG